MTLCDYFTHGDFASDFFAVEVKEKFSRRETSICAQLHTNSSLDFFFFVSTLRKDASSVDVMGCAISTEEIHNHPSEAKESLGLFAGSCCRTQRRDEEHGERDSLPFIKRPAGASQEDASVSGMRRRLVCVARRERADNRTQSKPLDVCARPGILPAPNEVVPPPSSDCFLKALPEFGSVPVCPAEANRSLCVRVLA